MRAAAGRPGGVRHGWSARARHPTGSCIPTVVPHALRPKLENRRMTVGGRLRVWIQESEDDAVCIRLAGELDLGTVTQLKQAVDAYARSGQTMIIDLRDVDLIDSM